MYQGLYKASNATGLSSLIAHSKWRRNRLLILCYHGVCDSDLSTWAPTLFISRKTFERRLEVLASLDYNVLDLGEAISLQSRRALPPRSVVITFDDGIQDFHRLVWPALRTHSFPATLYLCTHYVNRQLPVFDLACSYMLWRSLGKTLDWPRIIPAACILTEQNRTNITQTIQAYAWSESMTSEQKSALLEELAERLDFDYAELVRSRRLTLVSDNEAQEMAAEGLDIQLHTHRHQSPLDRASFFREIADNRSYIRRLTDKDPDHFAYPNGYHHPSHAAFLRELGVKTATTCYAGHTTRESPHLKLPRFVDSEAVPEAQFLAWCTGTADLLPHRKPVVPSSVEERRAHFESLAKPRRAAVE